MAEKSKMAENPKMTEKPKMDEKLQSFLLLREIMEKSGQ